MHSRFSTEYYIYTDVSGSVEQPAEVQDFLPVQFERLFFAGCRLHGPGINIPSDETPDGAPVIELFYGLPTKLSSIEANNIDIPCLNTVFYNFVIVTKKSV